jgi:PA domain
MSSSKRLGSKGLALAATFAATLLAAGGANAAATIIINNLNGPGVGFNDATPVAPIGGNTGTTLGEQRLIAFTYAANLWGATLTSNVPIVINAQFSALTCTATSAVLGSAGATQIFRNFPNAPKPDTWYSYALANKLAGAEVGASSPQINANFNVNLGQAGCLPGTFFYLGLDGNHGTNTDFVAVLQHEMGHGLGFQTFTNGTTGAFNGGFPAIWDHYLFSTAAGKTWKDATAAERVASAISVTGLVWTGPVVTAAVPSVLRQGTAALIVSGAGAGSAAGTYTVGEASFGMPINGSTPVTAQIMPVAAQTPGAGSGCEPFTENNIKAVRNRIALMDRGVCGFAIKTKNAQNAGAVGVIIADNVAGSPPPGLGGSDPTITIPAVRITLDDGNKLKSALVTRSRVASGVIGSLTTVGSQYSGADALGRIMMFAPNPFQGGSSVSHYDVSAFRNQLMEPAINGDLTQSVIPPQDLTFRLFQDIGW